jgi:hypothetical protein
MTKHRLVEITTAPELSTYLGIPEKKLRRWLRDETTLAEQPGKGSEWFITDTLKVKMIDRMSKFDKKKAWGDV